MSQSRTSRHVLSTMVIAIAVVGTLAFPAAVRALKTAKVTGSVCKVFDCNDLVRKVECDGNTNVWRCGWDGCTPIALCHGNTTGGGRDGPIEDSIADETIDE